MNGEDSNPELDYPKLDVLDLESIEVDLLSLKTDLLEREKNSALVKIYRAKINEHLAATRMLRAAAEGNDEKFASYSEFIHGKPTAENTAYVLDSIQYELLKDRAEWGEVRVEAADRILDLVSGYEVFLDDEVVTREILPKLKSNSEKVDSSEDVTTEIEKALQELGVDSWSVVIADNDELRNFSVSQETKEVRVPTTNVLLDRKMSVVKLSGLIAHEIKTHVQRRENGERSKLQLLGFGLDRYLKGEEGVATYAEQMETGATEFAGTVGYFSIAVAKGFDGKPRNFRDTYNIMKDYHLAIGSGEDASTTRAWNNCVRIFRGTSASTPGAVFTKDLAYMGNREIWQLVNDDSDATETFSLGKFDPTNSEHVSLLSQLGILESELDQLEE